jgi:hypothetical protein
MLASIFKVCQEQKWTEFELGGAHFGDYRLDQRLLKVTEDLSKQPEKPINQACGSWRDTKACYEFFSNDKVTPEEILRPHQEQTRERMNALPIVALVHDTTTLNFNHHKKTSGLGTLGRSNSNSNSTQGLICHNTMAMSLQGVPLGLLDQKIWSRDPNSIGAEELRETEAYKWFLGLEATKGLKTKVISIADREADISTLMRYMTDLKQSFVIRAKCTRSIAFTYPNRRLVDEMRAKPPVFEYDLEIRRSHKLFLKEFRKKGNEAYQDRTARVEVRFGEVEIYAGRPEKHSRYAQEKNSKSIKVNCVLVEEKNPPYPGLNEIQWILLTDLPVTTVEEVKEIIRLYTLRWGIEIFHKILKSGCEVEECRLQEAARLAKYVTLMSVIAWRLDLLTYFAREEPEASCDVLLSQTEWESLDCLVHEKQKPSTTSPTIKTAITWIACLGGYLNRNSDPPPGATAIWRGWHRLQDFARMYDVLRPRTT